MSDFVESEFLKRELGIMFECVNPQIVTFSKNINFLLTGNLEQWESRIRASGAAQFVVFLIGNEYYDIDKFTKLNDFPQIVHSFVQYLPENDSPISLTLFMRSTLQLKTAIFTRQYLSMILKAVKKNRALRKMEVPENYSFLPLGYTNRFVNELKTSKRVFVEDSLLQNPLTSLNQKAPLVCFMGQKGSWLRRKLVEDFSSFPTAIIKFYDGWGGQLDSEITEYSELLNRCQFVLCPPGNFSNECPRYYEVVALGGIPVVSSMTIQDFTNFDYWPSKHMKGFRKLSQQQIFFQLLKLDEATRTELQRRIFNDLKEKMFGLRRKIIELNSLNHPGINL